MGINGRKEEETKQRKKAVAFILFPVIIVIEAVTLYFLLIFHRS
jgi:hypothetical protein